jgi:hypothetical protein
MNRRVVVASLLAGPVLVTGVALLVFLLAADPNAYRQKIIAAANQATGSDLTINGPLDWTLWPQPGIKLNKIVLQSSPQKIPLLAAEEADLTLRWLPLLSGSFVIDGIALNSATIQVRRDDNGRSNWDAVISKLAQSTDQKFRRLSFNNTGLTLLSSKGDTHTAINNINADAENIRNTQNFSLQATFDINHQSGAGNNILARNTLSTTFINNSASSRPTQNIALKNTTLLSELSSTSIPGELNFNLHGDIDADTDKLIFSSPQIKLSSRYKSMAFTGVVTSSATGNFRADVSQGLIQISHLKLDAAHPAQALKFSANTDATIDLQKKQLTLRALQLQTSGPENNSATFSGTLGSNWETSDLFINNMQVTASLNTHYAPQPIALELASPLHLNFSQGHLQLAGFTLTALNTKSTGTLNILAPDWVSNLTQSKAVLAGAKISGEWQVTAFNPLLVFAALGKVLPAAIAADTPHTASFSSRLEGDSQQLALSNIKLTLGKATLRGDIAISNLFASNASPPLYKTHFAISQLEISPFSYLFYPSRRASGEVQLQGQLTVSGSSMAEWKKTISGTSTLALRNGVLYDVDFVGELLKKLDTYQALLPDLAATASPTTSGANTVGKKTPVISLSMENHFDKGIVHTPAVAINFGKITLSGSGAFDPRQQTINYLLKLRLDKSLFAESRENIDLPLECQGDLAEEQLDFFSALKSDCKVGNDGLHALLAKALHK